MDQNIIISPDNSQDKQQIIGLIGKRKIFNTQCNQPVNQNAAESLQDPTIYSKYMKSDIVASNQEIKNLQKQQKSQRQIFTYQQRNISNQLNESNSPSKKRFINLYSQSHLGDHESVDLEEIKFEESHKIPNENKNDNGLNYIWRTRTLRIVYFISKFIQQLKLKTDKLKFKFITKKIFNIIGDPSSDYDSIIISHQSKRELPTFVLSIFNYYLIIIRDKKLKKLLNRFKEFCQLDKYIKVLEPDSTFKMFWDTLVVLLIIINIFYIPMKLSFDISKKQSYVSSLLLETIPSWVFILEIILNFNTAYIDKGMIHTNRKQIFRNYIKSNFWWDLIVVIPFIMSQFDIPYTDFTLLLRVTRVRSMVENLEEVLNLTEEVQAVFELLKLVYFIIFVGHFCACAWHYLGIIQITIWEQDTCWLMHYGIYDATAFTRYVYSFYWSTITTLTVGYGDLVPITVYERIFVIIVALIVCGVFGYSISSIGEIFKQLQEKKAANRYKLKMIDQHIKKRGLNKYLQLKVRKYFEYYLQLESEENQIGDQLMSQLTKHLKEEVLIDMYKKSIIKSRLLRENFSDDTINKLCTFMKERKYAPEEEIIQRGEIANKLVFILSGEVSINSDQKNLDSTHHQTYLRTYKQGFVIGEREFSTNRMYDYCAKSLKFTQVAFLDYEDFLSVLRENNEEFEKFCLIRDNLTFNRNYKKLGQVCESCSSNHNFMQCPFLFLQPNQAKISMEFRKQQFQNRVEQERLKNKSACKQCLLDIQEAALGFILMNNILKESDLTDQYLMDLGFKLNEDDDDNNYSNSVIRHKDKSQNDNKLEQFINFEQDIKQKSKEDLEWDLGSQIRMRALSKGLNHKNKMGSLRENEEGQLDRLNSILSQRGKQKKVLQDSKFESGNNLSRQQSKLSDESNSDKPILKSLQLIENSLFEKKFEEPPQRQRKGTKKQSLVVTTLQEKREKHKFPQSQLSNISLIHNEKESKEDVFKSTEKIFEQESKNTTIENKENSKIQQIIKEITYERTDFDLERQQIYQLYFPIYNVDVVIKKWQQHYEQNMNLMQSQILKQLRMSKSKKSINPLQRIKQQTWKKQNDDL